MELKNYIWRGILISSKNLLDDFINKIAQTIKIGSILAINDYYRHSHEYYMFEFTSYMHTFQENKNRLCRKSVFG